MKTVYLDHAATTPVDPRVKQEMDKYYSEVFGNPGSFHSFGLEAKDAIEDARARVATIFHSKPLEVIFTGSGTESVNLAILGVAKGYKHKGNHIITTKAEHHAVLHSCEFLQKEGYNVTFLPVGKDGIVNPKDVEAAITDKTILVSIMYANNEIGTINPIKEIGEICKAKKVLFHSDACQAAGALDINVENLNVDLLSINGSKLYGPKGVGALFVKQGTQLKPVIHGGGQERDLRSGTEDVPAIRGLTKALELAQEEKETENIRLTRLRDYLIANILKTIPKTRLNGHATKRLPNNVNISFMDIEGEALILYLNEYGICVSTGSACTSKTLDPSHVILALGVPFETAHGSVRFTLGKSSTKEGMDHVLKVLPDVIKKLRAISPVNVRPELYA
tara:strand:+ start:27036 stop:28211 length:1176 start_codon:yes stop_codon:yes gene_type:complete